MNPDDDVVNEEETSSVDAFAALRLTNTLSSILTPSASDLPPSLPIFDHASSAAFPGEEVQFNFFEPRYVYLAEEATGVPVGEGGGSGRGGYFLLRARPGGVAVLLKIIERADLPSGNVAVRCIGGPRVVVLKSVSQEFPGAEPLRRAAAYHLDDIDDDDKRNEERTGTGGGDDPISAARTRCLGMLTEATSVKNLTRAGLPPLGDSLFSLWALRFVLAPSDVTSRWRWLECQSSNQRIAYVSDLLDQLLNRRRQSTESNDGIQP